MTKNRFVAEKLGLCWHETEDGYKDGEVDLTKPVCPKCNKKLFLAFQYNPDFTTDSGAVELLRLIMKRDDWMKFTSWSSLHKKITMDHWIYYEYITTPGALLDAVAEFFGWKEE